MNQRTPARQLFSTTVNAYNADLQLVANFQQTCECYNNPPGVSIDFSIQMPRVQSALSAITAAFNHVNAEKVAIGIVKPVQKAVGTIATDTTTSAVNFLRDSPLSLSVDCSRCHLPVISYWVDSDATQVQNGGVEAELRICCFCNGRAVQYGTFVAARGRVISDDPEKKITRRQKFMVATATNPGQSQGTGAASKMRFKSESREPGSIVIFKQTALSMLDPNVKATKVLQPVLASQIVLCRENWVELDDKKIFVVNVELSTGDACDLIASVRKALIGETIIEGVLAAAELQQVARKIHSRAINEGELILAQVTFKDENLNVELLSSLSGVALHSEPCGFQVIYSESRSTETLQVELDIEEVRFDNFRVVQAVLIDQGLEEIKEERANPNPKNLIWALETSDPSLCNIFAERAQTYIDHGDVEMSADHEVTVIKSGEATQSVTTADTSSSVTPPSSYPQPEPYSGRPSNTE